VSSEIILLYAFASLMLNCVNLASWLILLYFVIFVVFNVALLHNMPLHIIILYYIILY